MNKTKEYYDKYGERWAAVKTNSFWHEEQFRIFLEHVPERARILDIGCASGIHVPLFLGIGRNLSYEGIDTSETLLAIAQRRYPQLSFIEANISEEGVLDGKQYDAFWAAAVLMHISAEKHAVMFENLGRLAKGGIGYITIPEQRPSPQTEQDQRHFETYTKDEFSAYVKSYNWKILESGSMEGSSKSTTWNWFIVQLPR